MLASWPMSWAIRGLYLRKGDDLSGKVGKRGLTEAMLIRRDEARGVRHVVWKCSIQHACAYVTRWTSIRPSLPNPQLAQLVSQLATIHLPALAAATLRLARAVHSPSLVGLGPGTHRRFRKGLFCS